MEKINISELLEDIMDIKQSKTYYSNCFLMMDKIQRLYNQNRIQVYKNGNSVFLVEDVTTHFIIYFFCKKIEDLEEDLNFTDTLTTSKKNAVISIIEKDIDFEKYNEIFKSSGLKFYKKFIRKSLKNSEEIKFRELMKAEIAAIEDVDRIFQLLNDTFDIISGHLPNQLELEKMIQDEEVLVVKIKGKVEGVLLFENIGVKSYARALCIDEEYRNNVLGYVLLVGYLNRHREGTNLFYLWVDSENKEVLGLHNKLGYKEDGLVEYIFVG